MTNTLKKMGNSSEPTQYYFSPQYKPGSKELADSRARADAQQRKHNQAAGNNDGLFTFGDITDAVKLGWEDAKTEMYNNWSPVSDAAKWLGHRLNIFSWGDKNTTWDAIRNRSRQQYKKYLEQDDQFADKLGITGAQRAASRIIGAVGANFVDPGSIALTVATGGGYAGIRAGLAAAKAAKGANIATKAYRGIKQGRAAAKAYNAAKHANTLRKMYGTANPAGVARAKASMSGAHKAFNTLRYRALPWLGREGTTEFLEYGLSPEVGLEREHRVYRGNDGQLYRKDPEMLRSMFYQMTGGRSPYEQRLNPMETAMWDWMARTNGQSAEDLYYEAAEQGMNVNDAWNYMYGQAEG